MTYQEYKNLVAEHRRTDSVPLRQSIEEKVYDVSVALCERLEKLYNKYGQEFVDDSDYQMGKGWYTLRGFDETTAHLVYSDRWRYGGECDIGIGVPMCMLDVERRLEKTRELRTARIKSLNYEYECNIKNIEGLKNECQEILYKVSALEFEEKSEASNAKEEV